jgi:Ca-activated chloride channel family protein
MTSWHSPWAFIFIAVVALAFFFSRYRRQNREASLQFSSLQEVKRASQGIRSRLGLLPALLKVTALIFLIIALARPQEVNTKVKKNVEGIDIIICLDVSDSMLIEDMKPLNRLGAAKETIKNFVKKRDSDRIGLVVFAGESFTSVPPTLDYEVLLSRIDDLTTAKDALIKDGTALGVAMANAAGRLKDSNAKNRVMIFMTDGENNSGTIDPETGLEIAKGYGIKVYSVGIGRDGPTRIPIYQRDVFGNKVKTYQPFESTVNTQLLERMASETGGKYFRASEEDALAGVFREIDSLEKTKIDINRFTRYTEKYFPYLWTAIILYFLSLLLGRTWLRRLP